MPDGITYLPYGDTGSFSRLVTDYIGKADALKDSYNYYPDKDGLAKAIAERSKYSIDRKTLVDTLTRQYEGLPKYEAVEKNLALLAKDNTYTVCTAHQPNLMTGYLYFIYKIVHAIKLAEELQRQHPDKSFVPVYYIGSEDNDLEELGTFRYGDRKFVWDGEGQTGAVGKMNTKSLKPLLAELFRIMGPPGANYNELKDILSKAYLEQKSIAKATQYLCNELFGRYGLVVLDPDEAAFKRAILPILKEELLQESSYAIVDKEIKKQEGHYKAQAHPRHINLFYLKDNIRERIEKNDAQWVVVNKDIKWNKEELLQELEQHPERFSPNVILRGLLQESILPDVSFIGGGAEVAYWLQLKALFEHHGVFYPAVMLRQSVLWAEEMPAQLRQKLELSVADIFKEEEALITEYVQKHSSNNLQTDEEDAAITVVIAQLKAKAERVDKSLSRSAEAVLRKIQYQLEVLEKKMIRAEKKKMEVQIERIRKVKHMLFPNGGLQERIENFIPYYLQYGPGYIDRLKDAMEPMRGEFLILE